MHIALLCFLLVKEIVIYIFCVKRAYNKLEKESKDEREKQMAIVEDRYLVSADRGSDYQRIN